MNRSESIAELAKALSQFQAEVKQPDKDKTNPHFGNQYVTLGNLISTVNQYGTKHGLSFTQMPVMEDNKTGVQTIIFHTSGEFIEYDPLLLPMDRQNAQGAGSALTYSRRYSLAAAFGIDSDPDDDGNSASDKEYKNNNYNKQNNNNSQSNKNSGGSTKKASDGQVKFINSLIADMMKATGADRNKTTSALKTKEGIGEFASVKEMTIGQASAAIKFMQDYLAKAEPKDNPQQSPPVDGDMEPIDISDDDLPF